MERALNEVIWALLALGAPVEPFLHFMHVSSESVPQVFLFHLTLLNLFSGFHSLRGAYIPHSWPV